MTDRELLELADPDGGIWNPLKDDGDALRLAVQLGLLVNIDSGEVVEVCVAYPQIDVSERFGADKYAATRRAITRAAAEIGRDE
jgi:hypothetical protein